LPKTALPSLDNLGQQKSKAISTSTCDSYSDLAKFSTVAVPVALNEVSKSFFETVDMHGLNDLSVYLGQFGKVTGHWRFSILYSGATLVAKGQRIFIVQFFKYILDSTNYKN
jgi:hypothetical protein